MMNFRNLETPALREFREMKKAALVAKIEERQFFKRKARAFPAYIKQLDEAEQQVTDGFALLKVIDLELARR